MKQSPLPELIDHIGWDLWQAADVWKKRFTGEMVARGLSWYGEARGSLFRHIGREGIAQNELVARASMTKQAVQQHLDDLVRDGVVERVGDPKDARKKRIVLTATGRDALTIANEVKRKIEGDYVRLIGNKAMRQVKMSLDAIIKSDDEALKGVRGPT